jgi:predicted nicotinamide N-methyase
LSQNPEVVSGKRVVDVGCGCGIGAIAAKLAGAAYVVACDNDEDALLITQANAELNGAALDYAADVADLSAGFDLVLMADVLYDKSNYPLLQLVKKLAEQTIVADSRIGTIEDTDFHLFHTAQALTYPNLGEFDEFKDVHFFRAFSPLAAG